MARPSKDGLDYFPMDVDIDQDDKIMLIESEIPNSFGLIIKLLMKIYKNGYYLNFDSKCLRLFSKCNNISVDECKNLVYVCINEGLFNQKLFSQFNVLTSAGIQRRYFEAVKRRKTVNVDINLILVNINEFNVNTKVTESAFVSELCKHDVDKSTQSKVKESKEEKSKVKKSISFDFERFWEMYGKKVERKECEKIFSNLSVTDIQNIFNALPAYVKSTPNLKYRKNPLSYLEKSSWEDEIILHKSDDEAWTDEFMSDCEDPFETEEVLNVN